MQKRSHALLAAALLRSRHGFSAKRYERMFLLGSFQPDCNPLTFLKGSLRVRWLQGHNYPNSRAYIFRRIKRLQQRTCWTMWHYYTLGKLTHYLADAFTYPHNAHYPNRLIDHHRYETALRIYLRDTLSRNAPDAPCSSSSQELSAALDELHRRYMDTHSCVSRDTQYILTATTLLMSACSPPRIL